MKRRTFLKYLCSVVPVALIDPMYFFKENIPETVSFDAILPQPPEIFIGRDVMGVFSDRDVYVTAGADLKQHGSLIGIVRKDNIDWYIYWK